MPAVSPAAPARSVALARPAIRRRLGLVAALAAVLTLVGVLLVAGPASAHDQLLSSDPKDGATLDAAPEQISLTFSSEPLDTGIEIVLSGPDGVTARGEDIQVEDRVVTARLDAGLPAGAYDVAWHVVSSDGHPIEGELAYTVEGELEPEPSTEPSEPEMSTQEAEPTEPTADASTPSELAGAGDGASPNGLAVGGGILAAVLVVLGLLVIMRRKILENDRLRQADEAESRDPGKPNENRDTKH
ncbi:copper resistance protein CopC [Promicromonospora thailandica]|uniref:CopC domain-containing protein n=1 Tax=Promicromonospora thailandica TaxID=765201 RepID=A0A9X2FY68_9MICO|nr:copper resistance CopC family protein [Promicromonospora thailandica]MCP2263339.1 hypothetical protein [Promicromonospora thailandica]BFF19511.1 hypothetical protein GCM10025730_30320 [Promicromonospora thailandica]